MQIGLLHSLEHKRKYGKTWFEKFVSNTLKYPKQNTIVGLIDIFRTNQEHVDGLIDICEKNGFHQFRLIDTAGSAFTEQIDEVVPRLIKKYANCSFFGHFHNDFGLATELMVPGRMEKQVDGWRRIGLADNDMIYLIEHITVDIEHANGWMHEVVLPMIGHYPNTVIDIVLGVERHLDHAVAVLDKMMTHLPAFRES
ncbi:iron-containing redox enzyme family protein [Candidatus Spongiihabitans sp.]|uniref:iron-containing redox enzyme family protein n=1 Tax=Candidatus Spongiihabitans sp. TaxID=3101308 RepID=UPI003C6EC018